MLCELYRVVLRLSCHRTKHLTEQPKGGRRVLTPFQGFRGSVQGCLASCTQQRVMAEEAHGYFASWEMGIEGGGQASRASLNAEMQGWSAYGN